MRQNTPINNFYHDNVPEFLLPFLETEEMKRLNGIGMNCGCEYTSFQVFKGITRYSRFNHSLGCALIVWHFTGNMEQTLSALFHDIASPTFAHTVDFMRGDYLKQDATEEGTETIIRNSMEISALLDKLGIPCEKVSDYHKYPIADNNSPKLSADRLEYTLGNLRNYGLCQEKELKAYYDNITVFDVDGENELSFTDAETAAMFTKDALKCSRVYVSDEARYSMQMLSELLQYATDKGAIQTSDLYLTETELIARLQSRDDTRIMWEKYKLMKEIIMTDDDVDSRKIMAKKRYIDPYVAGAGRVSEINDKVRMEIDTFVNQSQNYYVCGK